MDSGDKYLLLTNLYLSNVLDVGQRDPLGWTVFHRRGEQIHVSQRDPHPHETLALNGQRFTPLWVALTPQDAIRTSHPTSYHRNYFKSQDTRQYLQVFTNFTRESIVDNQRKPKILSLPFPEFTDRQTQITHNVLMATPHYVPVRHATLNYLHIWIVDEDGHPVNFGEGTTHVSLHFRSQNPYK